MCLRDRIGTFGADDQVGMPVSVDVSGRGAGASVYPARKDIGSLLCRPRTPGCEACPLGASCLARARGTVESRPPPGARRPLPHQNVGVGVVRRGDLVLIARRPESGLLGGLWEFPGGKVEPGESPAEAVSRELMEEIGIEIEVGELIERVDHAYSHLRVTLYFHAAVYVAGEPQARVASEARWVDPKTLGDYAFPAASRPVISRLSQERAAG
jgi:A/G-specific adenine glycosylase